MGCFNTILIYILVPCVLPELLHTSPISTEGHEDLAQLIIEPHVKSSCEYLHYHTKMT